MTVLPKLQAALYRYAQGYDTNDMELLASAFVEDVSMTGMGQTVAGRDAMIERTSGIRAQVEADGGTPRHHVSNVQIVSESETGAQTRAYFLYSIGKPGALTVVTAGCYHDRWVVDDEHGWRIAERTVDNDIT